MFPVSSAVRLLPKSSACGLLAILATFLLPLPVNATTLSLCPQDHAVAFSKIAAPLIEGRRHHLLVFADQAPADCESLVLPVAAPAVTWARLVRPALLAAGNTPIILQGLFNFDTLAVSEVIVPQDDEPATESPAVPRTPSATPVTHRASWLWQPDWWLRANAETWQLAEQEQLQRLYITVPVNSGAVENPERLAQFLDAAHDRGLAVWAVVGDRRDVLAESLPALMSRANAYLAYNTTQDPARRLDGLQLDIEPYLLPGFNLDQVRWRERYLLTIQAVHEVVKHALALDLVMPVWWGNHPVWGTSLLDALPADALSITVMNYRTDEQRLQTEVQPFLAWGELAGTKIHVALEYGELADESRWHFYPATRGELWQVTLGNQQVLVLLDSEYSDLPGRGWKKAFESDYPAANLTFNGNRERLETAIGNLSPYWSAWSSFAGIAIHGAEALQAAREFE